jgi:transposase
MSRGLLELIVCANKSQPLNYVDPLDYLTDALTRSSMVIRIADIDELLPCAYSRDDLKALA